MFSPELTHERRRAWRLAFTDAPPPADPAAALAADLLAVLAAAGGRATLRQLFDRDASWSCGAAPRWALAAARRLDRDGEVFYEPFEDWSDVTLTLTGTPLVRRVSRSVPAILGAVTRPPASPDE